MDTKDFSQYSDEELDQFIQEAQAAGVEGDQGAEPAGPTLDEVTKGLRKSETDRAARDPDFAQSMLDRHLQFASRTQAGENPLETGDRELWRWQRATQEGPGLGTLALEGAKGVAHDTFELGKELVGTAADYLSGDYKRIEKRTPEAADLATVGGAKALAFNNVVARALFKSLPSAIYTKLAQKVTSDESRRELLQEIHDERMFDAARANYADERTAETFHKDIAKAAPILDSLIGTTEVNQAAANAIANIPQMAAEFGVARAVTSARRAVRVGEFRAATEKLAEARSAHAEVSAFRDAARSAGDAAPELDTQIAKLEDDIVVRERALLDFSQKASEEVEQLTQVAASRVAAGRTLGALGRATEKVGGLVEKLQALPGHLAARIAPDSPELAAGIEHTIVTGAAAGAGYAVGDGEGAAVGAVLGGAGAGRLAPKGLLNAGKDLRRVGEIFEMGQTTLPFWKNVAKARDVSGFLRGTAAFLDNSALAQITHLGVQTTKGAAAGAAVGAGFGALTNLDDPAAGAASGAGGGAMFGAGVGFLGQWRTYANQGQVMRERAGQTRFYKDLLQARPSELAVFEKLRPEQQDQIAHYLAAHPDLKVNYVDDPGKTPGSYDAQALPDEITVNLASNDPLQDIVGHEIAHYTENHELGAAVVRKALGDPEAGVPGDYTLRDDQGNPVIETTPEGKTQFKVNAEFQSLRDQYLARVKETAARRGWSPEKLASALEAFSKPEYIAREIWAEQHLEYLKSPEYTADLKGNTIGVPDWVMNSSFLKNALGKLGVVFNDKGDIIRSTILGDYKKSASFDGLVREYYRRRADARAGDVEFIGKETSIDEQALTKESGYVERYFDASGEVLRDTDGKPVYDENGRAKLRSKREADADVKEATKAVILHLDTEATAGTPTDSALVQKRTTVDGRTAYAGRFFSDAALEAIANTKRFNVQQMDNLRQINAELKAAYGREWTSFYQAATRKGGGSRARSLRGRWRTDLVYGFEVSQANNILVRSVSLEVLAQNAAAAVKKQQAKLWNNEMGDLLKDVRSYLDNLTSGRPGDQGIGVEKKNFINNLLGIRVKAEGDVNPWFEVTNQPKTILTSLRLDRMNRVTPVSERNVPFSAESYNRAKKNLRPDSVVPGSTADGAQEAGKQGTLEDMQLRPNAKAAIKLLDADEKERLVEGARFVLRGAGREKDAARLKSVADVAKLGDDLLTEAGNAAGVILETVADNAEKAAKGAGDGDGLEVVQGARRAPHSGEADGVQLEGERLPHAVKSKTVKLVHFTNASHGGVIDPHYMGKGRATPRDQYGEKASFWFQHGSVLNSDRDIIARSKRRYTAEVSGARIYDGRNDPLGHFSEPNRWKADRALIDAGYVGKAFQMDDGRKLVMMFEPVAVKDRGQFKGGETAQFRPEARRGIFEEDSEQFRPEGNEETRKVADAYVRAALGRDHGGHANYDELPEARIRAIADFFQNEAKHSPDDPKVRKSYDALISETKAQYGAMVAAGIQIEPWTSSKGEPYKSSADMMKDVAENKHLWFFLTDNGFGSGATADHPMLEPSGIKIGDRELLNNDLFRAVHDYFGHTQQGFQFGPRGEFNAWKSHSKMFGDVAQGALAAETLAQNAWVNFGPHLRDGEGKIAQKGQPGYVAPQERPFADQRAFVLPDELRARLRPDAGQVAARGVSTAPLFEGTEAKPDFGPRPTVNDVGRWLGARSRQLKRIPYDSRTPQAKQAIAATLSDEIGYALRQNRNALGWYETKINEAMDLIAQVHPEVKEDPDRGSLYKAITAITSNGQAVLDNFTRADELYRHWKDTGRLETDSPWGGARQSSINSGLQTLQTMIDERGLSDAMRFLNTKFTIRELKQAGFPIAGENVDHVVYGSAIFGPKVGGGFYPNLQGDFSPVTIDLWLMRTWNRINGSYGQSDPVSMGRAIADLRKAAEENPGAQEAVEIGNLSDRKLANWAEKKFDNWRYQRGYKDPTPFDRPAKRFVEAKEGAVESPRNGNERAWVREVFAEVDKVLAERGLPAINNADKQALLWYYEKDLYALFGVGNAKSEPADYAVAAQRIVDASRVAR